MPHPYPNKVKLDEIRSARQSRTYRPPNYLHPFAITLIEQHVLAQENISAIFSSYSELIKGLH